MEALSAAWLASPWLTWGVGPMAAVALGFFASAGLLELLIWTGWFDSALIVYPSASGAPKSRAKAVREIQAKIPFLKQLWHSARTVAGPATILNGLTMVWAMTAARGWGPVASWWPAGGALEFAAQFLVMFVVNDLGLYVGHRIQHEVPFLWRFHRVHHRIGTPTPVSVMSIAQLDATLQGGIPMALAAAAAQPCPAALYAFFAARVAENTLNHSGLDSPLLDALALKFLPFRASAAFHDSHHRFSNHAHNAKNYAESFWVFDWAFGTLSPLVGRPQGALSAAKQA